VRARSPGRRARLGHPIGRGVVDHRGRAEPRGQFQLRGATRGGDDVRARRRPRR
jgi:hypothetical protein